MAIPKPPLFLTAIASGGYQTINLSWRDESSDEDGFKIERSPNGVSSWAQIDTVTTDVTYYQDTGRSEGTPYYYRVRSYNGSGNSSYTNVASATTFQLSDVGTPYVHLDADLEVYSDAGITLATDGVNVQEWHDQSSNGYDVTQTVAAAKPVYQTNEINSHNVIRFAVGDTLKAAAAADWIFLHDGSAFTVFVVWKTTADEPDSLFILLDTGAISSADTGLCFFYDDRSAQTQYHKMRSWIADGGAFEAQAETYHEGVRGGRWHVSCTHRAAASDLYVENDGHWGGDGSDSATGTPDTGNPTSALAVGARYDNSLNLVGDIAYILIYDSDLSLANRTKVSQFLGETFAQPEYLYFEAATMLVDATSEITYDYASCGGLTIADNGDLVAAYAVGTAHALTNRRYVYVIISDDKGVTWGSPYEVWDKTNDGGGTIFYEPQGLTTLSDGRLYMKCGKYVGATVDDGLSYFTSEDNGATWDATPTEIAGSGTGYDWGGGGPILEIANGNYLFPYRYWDTGDAALLWTVANRYSDDDGVSWAELADITQDTEYDEPGIVQLASGTIVALIRDDEPHPRQIVYATSANNGQTWSGITYAVLGYGPLMPMITKDDDIIAHVRQPHFYGARSYACVLHMLGDDLDRVQKGHVFEFSPNDTGAGQPMYGQFAQDDTGTIYCVYGTETTEDGSSDIMFTKAPRPLGEYTFTGPMPTHKRLS